jgi:hypothetical protein
MGTLCQHRKGARGKIKKGQNVAVYKDKLMNLKWKDKEDVCCMSTTHDEKFVQSRV